MSHYRVVFRPLLILLFLAAVFAATMIPALAASHQVASPGDVVISEFRTRGPNGPTDDFVELYSRTALPINMSGWMIEAATDSGSIDLSPLVTFGSNFTLLSGQHFLAVGSGYNGSVPADAAFVQSIMDDGGSH